MQLRRKDRNERMPKRGLFTVKQQLAQHWGMFVNFSRMDAELLWRNRIARSALNRNVGGLSPPRSEDILQLFFRTGDCLEVLSYAVAAKNPKRKAAKPSSLYSQATGGAILGRCWKL